jgi:hypothetical protein
LVEVPYMDYHYPKAKAVLEPISYRSLPIDRFHLWLKLRFTSVDEHNERFQIEYIDNTCDDKLSFGRKMKMSTET